MAEYIERESAIEKIIRNAGLCAYNMLDGEAGGLLRAKDTLRKIPAADVAPVRHAKWIPCDNGGYYCSDCDSRVAFKFGNLYCPNCGARMDGDDHG